MNLPIKLELRSALESKYHFNLTGLHIHMYVHTYVRPYLCEMTSIIC